MRSEFLLHCSLSLFIVGISYAPFRYISIYVKDIKQNLNIETENFSYFFFFFSQSLMRFWLREKLVVLYSLSCVVCAFAYVKPDLTSDPFFVTNKYIYREPSP